MDDAPGLTKSMRVALEDLKLEHLWVVHPTQAAYSLEKRVEVIPLSGLEGLPKAIH